MAVFDRSSRFASDISGDGSQFDSGVFERLLDTIDQPGSVGGQTATVARQIPQFPLGTGRYKTSLQQTVLEQVSNPLGILEIRFPAWNRLDRLRIAQQQLHLPF
jgi:hypothetical protein